MRRVLGADLPNTLVSAGNLVSVLQELGEFSEAARSMREALEMPQRVLRAEL